MKRSAVLALVLKTFREYEVLPEPADSEPVANAIADAIVLGDLDADDAEALELHWQEVAG